MIRPVHLRSMVAGVALLLSACGGAASALSASGAAATLAPSSPPAATLPPTQAPSPTPLSPGTPPPTSLPTSTPSPTAAPASGTVVDIRLTGLGRVLVDIRGMTLYLFEADGSASTCYGSCAQNWPPLHTKGAPTAGSGSMQALLNTSPRKDRTAQVTYNGHPLYFFVGDSKPGDTHGEGINAFGGSWYVVSPSGAKIDAS